MNNKKGILQTVYKGKIHEVLVAYGVGCLREAGFWKWERLKHFNQNQVTASLKTALYLLSRKRAQERPLFRSFYLEQFLH